MRLRVKPDQFFCRLVLTSELVRPARPLVSLIVALLVVRSARPHDLPQLDPMRSCRRFLARLLGLVRLARPVLGWLLVRLVRSSSLG